MSNDSGLLTVRERQLIEAERQVAALRAYGLELERRRLELEAENTRLKARIAELEEANRRAAEWALQQP